MMISFQDQNGEPMFHPWSRFDKKNRLSLDGETLTDLRFADDVALLTKTPQQMESQMNTLNNISKTVGLKMHKGKTKFMINYPNQDSLYIENEEIEKVEHYKYLGQTTYLKETTKEENHKRGNQM